MAEINVYKLHLELEAANIEINGCDSNGIVWGKVNKQIQDLPDVQAILTAHDPSPNPDTILHEEYNKAGISSEKMIHALWKKVMNSDNADADALQLLIDQVNLSIGG